MDSEADETRYGALDGTGETYIGDGVYASFDGWMIKLRTPREFGDHVIYLEPNVYAALVEFARKLGWT